MGYQTYRIRRKTESGYDILHIESRADLVLRFKDNGTENGTVEDALAALESGKIALVTGAVTGNFPALAADGSLTDSGKKASDFAAADHNHTLGNINADTASRVIVSGANKVLSVSTITATELGYLSGATSNIQTQLNNKAAGDHNHDSAYVKVAEKGTTIPTMTDGKIDSQYLPSYVDDVLEGTYVSATVFNNPEGSAYTGETGKIYVDTATNKTYRWSGSAFIEVSAGVSLGTTSSTAFRGDYGQIAYEHSQAAHARTDATKTSASSTNGNILINDAETTVYTHPTYAGTESTGSATLAYGGTFDAISAVTLSNGHVSGYTLKTFTMPARPVDISFSSTQPTNQAVNDLWFEAVT